MKILSIDYGDKRIGLALSEDHWIKPLKPILNQSKEQAIQAIEQIITKHSIDKVILGLPIPLRAKTNERLRITQSFAKKLQKRISVTMELTDETFTTKLAKMTAYTKAQKNNLDSRAASFILEQYLNKKK